MSDDKILWVPDVQAKFDQMIAKIPVFLRDMAKKKVGQKAQALAAANDRREVSEKDMIDAFFVETPFGFHGPMKTDMQGVGIDYAQYGYDR